MAISTVSTTRPSSAVSTKAPTPRANSGNSSEDQSTVVSLSAQAKKLSLSKNTPIEEPAKTNLAATPNTVPANKNEVAEAPIAQSNEIRRRINTYA